MWQTYFFKKQSLVIFLLILVIWIGYSYLIKESFYKDKIYTDFPGYEEERQALKGFVNKYFIEDGFCRANLKNSIQRETASGQDILSESIGLLMLYYIERDEQQNFQLEVNILKNNFLNKNGLVKWRIRRKVSRETVNATIDDLRIVKALLIASKKWGEDDYKKTAKELSTQLFTHCVTENRLKAYDSPNSPKAPFVYYDFKAMQLMGEFNKKWYELAIINRKNILKHKVKGLPFYRGENFFEDNKFSMVENLIITMHFYEVGIKDSKSIIWLKDQLKKKGLYSSYSVNGKPLSRVESPAIYAIVARIAKLNNDNELYYLAVKRLKNMQNLEENAYYGGFINLNRRSAFSFDQLLSLLAY